jgi:hypothetical protein
VALERLVDLRPISVQAVSRPLHMPLGPPGRREPAPRPRRRLSGFEPSSPAGGRLHRLLCGLGEGSFTFSYPSAPW